VTSKRDKLLQALQANINTSLSLHGINEVNLDLVRQAVESLEVEGWTIETLRGKEKAVATRIIRLNPGKVAL